MYLIRRTPEQVTLFFFKKKFLCLEFFCGMKCIFLLNLRFSAEQKSVHFSNPPLITQAFYFHKLLGGSPMPLGSEMDYPGNDLATMTAEHYTLGNCVAPHPPTPTKKSPLLRINSARVMWRKLANKPQIEPFIHPKWPIWFNPNLELVEKTLYWKSGQVKVVWFSVSFTEFPKIPITFSRIQWYHDLPCEIYSVAPFIKNHLWTELISPAPTIADLLKMPRILSKTTIPQFSYLMKEEAPNLDSLKCKWICGSGHTISSLHCRAKQWEKYLKLSLPFMPKLDKNMYPLVSPTSPVKLNFSTLWNC